MNPPGTPSQPDWDAIARFLAGESTPDERQRVEEWLQSNPAERALVSRLEAAGSLPPVVNVDVEAALSRVHGRMAEAVRRPPQRGRVVAWRSHPWSAAGLMVLAAAAVVAIAVILRRSPGSPPAAPATARTYATSVGQRDSVTLADGSRVMLGPDTRLTVPADYGSKTAGGSRTVELHGDAYFDVRHDATQPFMVRVASAVIEDIGTTFTVESDDADTTHVAVVTGSVRLRARNAAPTSGVILQAGDRGAVDRSGRASVMRHSVRADDTAWMMGQVIFRDASLARVAAEIRRWYGVQLRVTDSSLLTQHLNTSFNGEPVDQVLKRIGLMLGVRVVRQGDTATLTSTHGPAAPR